MGTCLPMQETGFDLWSGKISPAAEQLSQCTTTTEACMLQGPRATTSEPWAATTDARAPYSQQAKTTELMRLMPVLHTKKSRCNEKPPHSSKELNPLPTTREKAVA